MTKKLQISKFLIVAILLAAYSGIYTTDFLCFCNLKHSELIASEQTNHHSKKKDHIENITGKHHDNKDSKSNGCSSNGCDCCNELTSIFVADLPKIITPTFQNKVKTFNTTFFIHNITLPKHDCITEQLLNNYKLPPPKIPDIRVFIQSFII